MPSQASRVVVVGGGAAGFFGAIACAESSRDQLEITILEGSSEVLQKVRISGGGRCNVTHDQDDPRIFSQFYPRGSSALIGPLHRWRQSDTVAWFSAHGVDLTAESDGRMFPVTNRSSTVVDCLQQTASNLGITVTTGMGVRGIGIHSGEGFKITTRDKGELSADAVLIATGGVRNNLARAPVDSIQHALEPPVPSLFTFRIDDPELVDLAGISVASATMRVPERGLTVNGPVLITHWGLSGPAVLRMSAWGARELEACGYCFELQVDWSGGSESEASLRSKFSHQRQSHGARRVNNSSILSVVPRRLWGRLVRMAGIPEDILWSGLSKAQITALCRFVLGETMQVDGKSMNKEEFVTCGGVALQDVDLTTMESRRVPGIYFAGEVLDIDGLTGGFNFQSAWTTGRIAGASIAAGLQG
ncbi:MAG: aminoacetone oxidase family FAD-binding enzyme [Verrucomicrobiaceae bacterium]|nr:aminoacetone oxidase family FAD-binding enzyme [Verrucomicrobiaceae bacterium]